MILTTPAAAPIAHRSRGGHFLLTPESYFMFQGIGLWGSARCCIYCSREVWLFTHNYRVICHNTLCSWSVSFLFRLRAPVHVQHGVCVETPRGEAAQLCVYLRLRYWTVFGRRIRLERTTWKNGTRARGRGHGGTGGSTTVGALHLSRKVTTICKSLSDLLFAAPPKYVKFRSRKKKGLRAPDVKF